MTHLDEHLNKYLGHLGNVNSNSQGPPGATHSHRENPPSFQRLGMQVLLASGAKDVPDRGLGITAVYEAAGEVLVAAGSVVIADFDESKD